MGVSMAIHWQSERWGTGIPGSPGKKFKAFSPFPQTRYVFFPKCKKISHDGKSPGAYFQSFLMLDFLFKTMAVFTSESTDWFGVLVVGCNCGVVRVKRREDALVFSCMRQYNSSTMQSIETVRQDIGMYIFAQYSKLLKIL